MSRKLPLWYCRHSQAEKSKMKSTTAETLRGLLDYEPETGVFRWRVNRSNIKMGDVAGSVHNRGYTCIGINGIKFLAHRLAWLYTYDTWPDYQIDHINGDKRDNRIANLRDVSPSINLQNQTRPQRGNASGFLGVSRHKHTERWHARIKIDKRHQHIGYFDTAEAAHAAYLAAKLQLHPGDVRNLTEIPS
jgi:hypothetical protein